MSCENSPMKYSSAETTCSKSYCLMMSKYTFKIVVRWSFKYIFDCGCHTKEFKAIPAFIFTNGLCSWVKHAYTPFRHLVRIFTSWIYFPY